MSKRTVAEWLGDIISWGERLEGHIAGMEFDDFLKDPKTQDAASKCAESIGMAANELSKLDSSLDREFPGLNLSLACKSRMDMSVIGANSGRHLLAASISLFDPERTCCT
jgi:hypothetical protein